eukprot:gnl/TRDRNA2_/TRDRNA2_29106_c0_seq2.p1 gnl/TRDRNA2_/TRDRNA2_29106_c0~~gnl/TRDRNA2_/TRDRNA2_29106_c0_seq2.p1  ORF type:complete len:378 (+),score=88.44 gnl/TRDRNA2_/TRDRNA2_29106_c0_seq2:50-1183(+)
MSASKTGDIQQINYHRDVICELPTGAGANEEPQNAASVKATVRTVVEHARDAKDEEMKVSVVSGGITNKLFKVTFAESASRPSVLVRVFGGEGMIDRDLESATFRALAEAKLGHPGYYGRFGNGRCEGFIEGATPLELSEMADPSVSEKVAGAMAKFHRYELPAELQPFYTTPSVFEQLWSWLEQAKRDVGEGKLSKWGSAAEAHWKSIETDLIGESFALAEAELRHMQAQIPTDLPTAFCNNDLLAGNILMQRSTGEIHLIDFEYGGCNYRGFEIANHWNEWAGGTQVEMNGRCEYHRFPSEERQKAFCLSYAAAASAAGEDVTAEARLFVPVNHWYWGLWAVNQAVAEGVEEFDYLTYCEQRIRRAYEVKGEYSS